MLEGDFVDGLQILALLFSWSLLSEVLVEIKKLCVERYWLFKMSIIWLTSNRRVRLISKGCLMCPTKHIHVIVGVAMEA